MNRSYALFISCIGIAAATAFACTVGDSVVTPSLEGAAAVDATATDGGGAAADGTATDGGARHSDSGSADSDIADAAPTGPLADAGTVSVARDAGTPISPFAFGQNYWDWVDWANNGMTGLTGTEPLVTALHLNVLRAGGFNNDTNSPQPFDATQIDRYVAYCRSVGAEPILQVPVIAKGPDAGAATAQTAADMVTYANVTKGYGIRYWEIGNEPDIYSTNFDSGVPLTAADYCSVYTSYVAAMKAANAPAAGDGGVALQFVGPDLAWKYIPGNDWLTPFLDGCKDYVDVVSIHRYPFSAAMLSPAKALSDNLAMRSTLTAVRAIVDAHARPGARLAVTESNVSYDFDPTKYASAASLQAQPGTFYAALWAADALGVALENHLWTLGFWNLGEGDSTGSVLGFIVGGQPVPSYYAEQLLSAHFRGDVLLPTGVPAGFSVYASHDPAAGTGAVLVLNKTPLPSAITLAVDGLPAQSLSCPAMSMTLTQIPDAVGGVAHLWQYTSDMAAANLAPKQLR